MKTYVITQVGAVILNLPETQQIVVDDNDKPDLKFWVLNESDESFLDEVKIFNSLMGKGGESWMEEVFDVLKISIEKQKIKSDNAANYAEEVLIALIAEIWDEYHRIFNSDETI